MNSSDTLAFAKALSASKLRASLDRAGRAVPARLVAGLRGNHDLAHERAYALGDRGGVAHTSLVA